MSETEKAETPAVPEYGARDDRKEVVDDLQDAMSEGFYNALEGRVRDAENERVRIKWLRAAIAAATEFRQQVAELEKEEQEERIERIEQQIAELKDDGRW